MKYYVEEKGELTEVDEANYKLLYDLYMDLYGEVNFTASKHATTLKEPEKDEK